MGTRSDYYIREDRNFKWLGSKAYDGYKLKELSDKQPISRKEYLEHVESLKFCRDNDWTDPEEGWPWPWATSRNTDYAYVYDIDQDKLEIYAFEELPEGWPDMTIIQNVRLDQGSGIMLLKM